MSSIGNLISGISPRSVHSQLSKAQKGLTGVTQIISSFLFYGVYEP
jgi:hypothetical protein